MKKPAAPGRPASKLPDYKNPSVSAAARVKDLLARMTLNEEAPQMMCVWQEQAQKPVADWDKFEQSYL